jgi:hypothetical protein
MQNRKDNKKRKERSMERKDMKHRKESMQRKERSMERKHRKQRKESMERRLPLNFMIQTMMQRMEMLIFFRQM